MVRRMRLGPTFVYLDAKRAVARRQIRDRSAYLEDHRKPRPTSRQVIAVLLELIRDPHVRREHIVGRCEQSGVTMSEPVVTAVFETYELEKKRALSRSSTSSRRSARGPPPA